MNDPDRWHTSDRFDDDAIFADIVAHLNDDEAGEAERTPPPAKDAALDKAPVEGIDAAPVEGIDAAPLEGIDAAPLEAIDETIHAVPGEPIDGLDGLDEGTSTPQVWRSHEVDDEYEEHFEPLPTAPLPVGDLQFWAIIAGMGGGPLLLLYVVFFNREAGSYWMIAAIAMSVGGFALLVSRHPHHHEEDDNGARL